VTGTTHAWVDLLDVRDGHRVLLVDAAGRRGEETLRQRTSSLTVVADDDADAVARVLAEGAWDLVCLDAVQARTVPTHLWDAALTPEGRVVVVGDHLLSPLRVLDVASRRAAGPGARLGHGAAARSLEAAGLVVHQVFGLLRSSNEPVVAFDSLAPTSLAAVAGSTLAHVDGWRGRLLGVATSLSGPRMLLLCPGWVVVATRGAAPDPDRIVGKVSNRDSHEVKLLRGEPVASVERQSLHRVSTTPANEAAALCELEAVGFDLSPRVLGDPLPTSSRCSWMSGSTLPLGDLAESELCSWVARAAEVLLRMQRATLHDDGTVLVHGDYWLGNLLVEGGRVSAVVDWADAFRGSPEHDRDFLVASLERWITSEALRDRLVRARDEVLSPL